MIKHYFTIAIRNILKNSFFAGINIVGLAIGMASFLLLIFYTNFEWSFDQEHEYADNIYRVESRFYPETNHNDRMSTSSFGYGPSLKREMSEVDEFCRLIIFQHEKDVKYKDEVHREINVFPADSNFFTFFSYPLIQGDPCTVLSRPNTMVLSEKAARIYFKNDDPVGKVMEVKTTGNSRQYTVTGVFKDIPPSSNLQFDFLLSYDYNSKWLNTTWYMHEAYLYVKVANESAARSIESKFPEVAEKYKTRKALSEKKWGVELIPLKDIHLNSPKAYELENKGNRRSVLLLLLIGFIVLIVAWINYINLSTTKALQRTGEISIRKANGARLKEIITQFLIEAAMINIGAILLSFLILLILLPVAETILPESALTGFWSSAIVWKSAGIAFVTGIALTGLAPSLILFRVKTSDILRNKASFKGGNKRLREALVLAQFITSVILIIGTLTVRKQINFMRDRTLGVDIEQTLIVEYPSNEENYNTKIESLKEEIKQIGGVTGICTSSSIPGKSVNNLCSNRRANDPSSENKLYDMLRVDYNYIDLYNLYLLAGRNFSREFSTDIDGIVLTETASRQLGFRSPDEAVDQEILLEGNNKHFKVIGVLDDYHHLSPKDKFRPMMLFMAKEHRWIQTKYISVKLSSTNMVSSVQQIETKFKRLFPNSSFQYQFLDESYNYQYNTEIKFGLIFMIFTGLAIFIVLIGIIGLSNFILLKRTMEIGVRKVHGASISNILYLLSKDFVRWIFYALIVGGPVAYYLMERWLSNFPFRTEISGWIFFLTGVLSIVMAFSAITWQCLKAARQNPVEALRYE